LENQGLDGRKILKSCSINRVGEGSTGFFWLRVGRIGERLYMVL